MITRMRSLHCGGIAPLLIVALLGWQCSKLYDISLAPLEPHETPDSSSSSSSQNQSRIDFLPGHSRPFKFRPGEGYKYSHNAGDLGNWQSAGDSFLSRDQVGNPMEVNAAHHHGMRVHRNGDERITRPLARSNRNSVNLDEPVSSASFLAPAVATESDLRRAFESPRVLEEESKTRSIMSASATDSDTMSLVTLGEVLETFKGAKIAGVKTAAIPGDQTQFAFAPLRPSELRQSAGTTLLPLSLDCTEDGTGAAKGPRGGCAQTNGFKQCDESVWEGGWALHERRLNNTIKICNGPISKIYCTIHSNKGTVANNDPVARFCWVERLFAPSATAGGGLHKNGAQACADDRWGGFAEEPQACRFKAYCQPSGWWATNVLSRSTPGSPEHPLFRGWGKQSSRSPFGRRLVEVVSDRSKWPAHLLKPSAPSSEFLKVDASSGTDIERAVPSGRASSGRFVYLSMGDCSARHEVVEPPKPKVEPTIEPKTEASTLLPKDNNRSNRRSTVLYSRTMTFSSPPSSSRPPIEASPTRRRQLLSFLLPKLPADGAARARAAALSGRVHSAFNPAHCHADPVNAALVLAQLDHRYGRASLDGSSSTGENSGGKVNRPIDRGSTSETQSNGAARSTTPPTPWTALLLYGHHYYKDNRRDPAKAEAAAAAAAVAKEEEPTNATMSQAQAAAELADRWPVYSVWDALFGGQVLTREAFYSTHPQRSFPEFIKGQSSSRNEFHTKRDVKLDEPFIGATPFEPGEEIAVAALPPNSMSSFWWAPHTCRAARRSPTLAAFRERAGPCLDALAWAAWTQGGVGNRVLARALAKHWPSPAMLALPIQSPQSVDKKGRKHKGSNLEPATSNPIGWVNWAHSNPVSSGSVMHSSSSGAPAGASPNASSMLTAEGRAQATVRALTLSEASPSDWLLRGDLIILVDRAPSRGRAVHNVDDLWKTLRKKFGHRHALIRVVTDSKMSYLAQYALWRSAALIVGVHGGNLGGTLWLSPGQSLLELGFTGCQAHPTQFAHVAAANGARYRCVTLQSYGSKNKPASKDDGGNANVERAIAAAREMLGTYPLKKR